MMAFQWVTLSITCSLVETNIIIFFLDLLVFYVFAPSLVSSYNSNHIVFLSVSATLLTNSLYYPAFPPPLEAWATYSTVLARTKDSFTAFALDIAPVLQATDSVSLSS